MIEYPTQVTSEINDAEVVPTIRRPVFDWSGTQPVFVPGEPFASHLMNSLHIILPAGERWFVDVYKQAVPRVTDELLRDQLRNFIGQEAMHAEAHSAAVQYLQGSGIDTVRFSKWVDFLLGTILGDHTMPRALQPWWLRFRVGLIAGVEHYTAVLGQWILDTRQTGALEAHGADPLVLDLLRWHGAEEVEHRFIAFETYRQMGGGEAERAAGMFLIMPILIGLLLAGARWLELNDPTVSAADKKRVRYRVLREWKQSSRKQILPSLWDLIGAAPRYLRRDYHPAHEGNTAEALAYLATSPGANGMYSTTD